MASSALDHVEPSTGAVTGALSSELSTVVNGTSDEIAKASPLDTVASSALDPRRAVNWCRDRCSELRAVYGRKRGPSDENRQGESAFDTVASSGLDHVEPSTGTVTGALESEPSTIEAARQWVCPLLEKIRQ